MRVEEKIEKIINKKYRRLLKALYNFQKILFLKNTLVIFSVRKIENMEVNIPKIILNKIVFNI